LVLAVLGGALFWLSSGWIARLILDDARRAPEVAWLSIGVTLTVAVGSQSALLTGMHRIGDLARISAGSGVVGGALGVLALWLWPGQGLIVMVVIVPGVSFLLGYLYIRRVDRPSGPSTPLSEIAYEWRSMTQVGVPFMAVMLIALLSQLAVRTLVQRQLGPVALGQFQAAWAIGSTYIGFIIGSMGTDFYPRLSGALEDRATAVKIVNEQIEVALLLCAPVLLAVLGCAPWLIHLLYSSEFGPTVGVLRWQLLGDIPKVMGWPLSTVLVASAASKTYFISESFFNGIYVLGVWAGLPLFGVTATGIAYLLLYMVYLPVEWLLCRRRIGFQATAAVQFQAIAIIIAAVLVAAVSNWSNLLGAGLGSFLTVVAGCWALSRLSAVVGASGRLGRIGAFSERVKRLMTRKK
jgi:O-antigen/teichoic acid export membrane protein